MVHLCPASLISNYFAIHFPHNSACRFPSFLATLRRKSWQIPFFSNSCFKFSFQANCHLQIQVQDCLIILKTLWQCFQDGLLSDQAHFDNFCGFGDLHLPFVRAKMLSKRAPSSKHPSLAVHNPPKQIHLCHSVSPSFFMPKPTLATDAKVHVICLPDESKFHRNSVCLSPTFVNGAQGVMGETSNHPSMLPMVVSQCVWTTMGLSMSFVAIDQTKDTLSITNLFNQDIVGAQKETSGPIPTQTLLRSKCFALTCNESNPDREWWVSKPTAWIMGSSWINPKLWAGWAGCQHMQPNMCTQGLHVMTSKTNQIC